MEPVASTWEALRDRSRLRFERLQSIVSSYGRVVIAYSGGCDSAFLLKVSTDLLGANALGLTAVGESLAPGERRAARELAQSMGANHVELESHEIENPAYSANPTNRCYHCKTELYDLALGEARRLGIPFVASGTNA